MRHSIRSVRPVFGFATDLPPNGSLNKPLQFPCFLVYLGKHEALEEVRNTFDLDGPCHAAGELVTIPKELMAKGSPSRRSNCQQVGPLTSGGMSNGRKERDLAYTVGL